MPRHPSTPMLVSSPSGIIAGLVLVAFVGTPDMKPSLIAAAVKEAGLKDVELPTCDVAGKAITNGSEAKCFASYMRIHALEATGGKTYSHLFAIVVGIALLLSGLGFIVLAAGLLGPEGLRRRSVVAAGV